MRSSCRLAWGRLGFVMAAASVPATAIAAPATHSNSCFWVRSVDGFRSVDNQTVYVRVGARSVYELKLFAPCLDVDWSHHIGLRARGNSSICEGTAHSLEIYTHSSAGHQRCPVNSVRKLTPEEVSALPKGARP